MSKRLAIAGGSIIGIFIIAIAGLFALKQARAINDIKTYEIASTCWMNYLDENGEAQVSNCSAGEDSAHKNYGNNPEDRPGDFPVILRGTSLEDLLNSDLNVSKFKADERAADYIFSEGNNTPPLMSLTLSELKANFNVVNP